MHTPLILAVSTLFATTLAVDAGSLAAAPAQDKVTSTSATTTEHHAVVTGKKVNVRTSASVEGGYHFFQVNEGDLVTVLYERFGWSRVRTDTPVFRKAFGFVSADAIEVDDDTGRLIARARLNAPNSMQSNRPEVSWEGLDPILEPGATVTLLEMIPASASGDPAKWKIVMPATQEAWVNSTWLRKATPAEVEAKMPKKQIAETTPEETAPKAVENTEEIAPVTQVAEKPEVEATKDAETTTPTIVTDAASSGTNTTNNTDPAAPTTTVETEVAANDESEKPADMSTAEARAARLAALDKAFRLALKERIESAELEILQNQFVQFADLVNVTDVEKQTALARADVLELKVEVQDQLARLLEMRERTQIDMENINATRVAMDARAPYDVVGKLNASVVFSGEGTMPLLFRLQDSSGGQTIAYIRPDERFDISAMTGLLVGIIGTSRYDEALQLNVVRPRRIDLLGPRDQSSGSTAEPETNTAPATIAEGEADGVDSE